MRQLQRKLIRELKTIKVENRMNYWVTVSASDPTTWQVVLLEPIERALSFTLNSVSRRSIPSQRPRFISSV
jgi:hypothetical protein